MSRVILVCCLISLLGVAGCKKPPSPEMIAKLKGGTTTVVAYGFCIPMAHLIKNTFTRHTLQFVVNGKVVGTMKSCGFGTFRVPSGYWSAEFRVAGGFGMATGTVFDGTFRPGQTQYLHMSPAGHGMFHGRWVSKAQADAGIAEIKKIGQMW